MLKNRKNMIEYKKDKKREKMEQIREKLFKLADKKYQKFHSRLCPNTDNIIGVRIPKLREIAREIAKENPKEFLNRIDDTYYETVMLYGMVIGYIKADIEERQKYLDIFVPKINNWAVCDCCTSTYKFTNKKMEEMWNYIQKYLKSNQEFEIRFSVIMMMDYYLNDKYIDKVFTEINKIHHEGYYVKMGVAWLISIAFVKYEEKTRKFLANNQLDDFTYNKALQKIIESNRVTQEVKSEMKNLKR